MRALRLTAGGDSLVASHGDVGLGADMTPEYQAGVLASVATPRGRAPGMPA
jgi:hypothetical protein